MGTSYHPIALTGLSPGRVGYVEVKTPGQEGQNMFVLARCFRIAPANDRRPAKIEVTLVASDNTLFYVPSDGFFDRIES